MDKEVKNKIKNGIQQKLKQTALPTKPFLLTLAETLAIIRIVIRGYLFGVQTLRRKTLNMIVKIYHILFVSIIFLGCASSSISEANKSELYSILKIEMK